jgi:hypothetical protein
MARLAGAAGAMGGNYRSYGTAPRGMAGRGRLFGVRADRARRRGHRALCPSAPATDLHVAEARDSGAMGAWRERMGTGEAKAIYKVRSATAERISALARQRGLTRLRVRGMAKVRCVLPLQALVRNLMRTLALAPGLLGYGEGAPRRHGGP